MESELMMSLDKVLSPLFPDMLFVALLGLLAYAIVRATEERIRRAPIKVAQKGRGDEDYSQAYFVRVHPRKNVDRAGELCEVEKRDSLL